MRFKIWFQGICVAATGLMLISTLRVHAINQTRKDLAELLNQARITVVSTFVYVIRKNERGEDLHVVRRGSGFFIDKRGYIITAAHGLTDTTITKIEVVTYTGQKYAAKKVADNPLADLAVMALIGSGRSSFPVLPISPDLPALGEEVIAIGDPIGDTERAVSLPSVGVVLNYMRFPNKALGFETTKISSDGSSGCLVMNKRGQIIGVVRSESYSEWVTYVVEGQYIRDLQAKIAK